MYLLNAGAAPSHTNYNIEQSVLQLVTAKKESLPELEGFLQKENNSLKFNELLECFFTSVSTYHFKHIAAGHQPGNINIYLVVTCNKA